MVRGAVRSADDVPKVGSGGGPVRHSPAQRAREGKMATIHKQGIDRHVEARRHVGEDKSFGRASLARTRTPRSGLNPYNAVVDETPDHVLASPPVTPTGWGGLRRH